MTQQRQLVIAAVGGVLLTVLFFLFVLKPKLDQVSRTRAEVEAARDEEQSLRAEIARLEDARRNAPRTTARLATLARYLPNTPDIPGFIRLVQAAANESVIDLRSIAPSPPQDLEGSQGIQTITVSLTIRGGFHRVEDFVSRLERLERVVEVRALSLTPGTDALSDRATLDGTVTMRMYVVQDDARFSRVRRSGARPRSSPSPGPARAGGES